MKRATWLEATAASVGAARSLVREAASEAGLEDEPTWDLTLATTEAVTNAVQHGKAWPNGCILFVTEQCPRGVRVEVYDLGTFDTTLEPAALEATSGRGMQIIAALADRIEVRNGNGRTLVRFEKHRASATHGNGSSQNGASRRGKPAATPGGRRSPSRTHKAATEHERRASTIGTP